MLIGLLCAAGFGHVSPSITGRGHGHGHSSNITWSATSEFLGVTITTGGPGGAAVTFAVNATGSASRRDFAFTSVPPSACDPQSGQPVAVSAQDPTTHTGVDPRLGAFSAASLDWHGQGAGGVVLMSTRITLYHEHRSCPACPCLQMQPSAMHSQCPHTRCSAALVATSFPVSMANNTCPSMARAGWPSLPLLRDPALATLGWDGSDQSAFFPAGWGPSYMPLRGPAVVYDPDAPAAPSPVAILRFALMLVVLVLVRVRSGAHSLTVPARMTTM